MNATSTDPDQHVIAYVEETPLESEEVRDPDQPSEGAESTWIPANRTLREELTQKRYLALAMIALVVIGLQLWLLF